MSKEMIYLDYAAATPLDPSVFETMRPYLTDQFYNASAQYLAAKSVAASLRDARAKVAHWFGARPIEVIFTAGGTEANNLAIHGVMQQFPGSNIVASSIEHESVLMPAQQYDHRESAVLASGLIDIDALHNLIDDKTVLVSVMYANNEIGTIQPIAAISRLISDIRQERAAKGNTLPLYLHTDACQAPNYLHISVDSLGVDMMTINAGKIYGPKQCGALYVKSGTELQPQILGGGQESSRRSGTENTANIIGFGRALDIAQQMRGDEAKRLSGLRDVFIKLLDEALPQARITASHKYHLPNNVHVTIPGKDNERMMMQLDEMGIMCATGSACSASSDEPSHVLRAIGLSDQEARTTLRFTMGRQTTETDIRRTVECLRSL